MAEENKASRFKLDRRLLIWVLPATLIPTVLFLVLTKGSDLGQKEDDAAAAERVKKEQAQRMSARVVNPEQAAMEEARRALEGKALPPPPTMAEMADTVEEKSNAERLGKLKDAREVIAPTLNDAERQSTGLSGAYSPSAEKRQSFVVYTAPSKEGLVSGTVNAVTPDLRAKEETKPAKPFLSANNDKVGVEGTTVASRVDGLYWLAPGTIIRAVLLNAIDTRIPGQVTARTTEPVYDSRYGRYLVIPAGSTLIGHYDSAIADGQVRVMTAFRSLVTPSGGVVNLNGTMAGDALGRSGVSGELHTYFWQRMGVATLFALEAVALDRLTDSETTVTTDGSTSTSNNTSEAARIISDAAKQSPWLRPVQPNITVEEGQKISLITMAHIEVPPVANKR